MKVLLSLVLLMVPSLGAYAAVFYTGYDLNVMAQAYERVSEHRANDSDFADSSRFLGYVVGTNDSLGGILFCVPGNTRVGQLASITSKYTREHPERWGEAGSNLVVSALAAVFPCPKK